MHNSLYKRVSITTGSLKAIDSIQSSAEIGEHERTKLIKTIIDDSGIESILVAKR